MPIKNAREITIETNKNSTFATRKISVDANEPIALTLSNPDVVPHNCLLVRRGMMQRVDELSNRLIADPDAFARQYIPETEASLAVVSVASILAGRDSRL